LNEILWTLLTALKSNAPETLKHLDLTGLPMTFIIDKKKKKANLNVLTESDILRQLKQKGKKS
jgi:hypothetical protein